MKEIQLSKGKTALIDDSDFEAVSKFKWTADKHRNTYYARRNKRIEKGKYKKVYLHQELLGGEQIDHKDGDGLNNQRWNLRPATSQQNARNRGRQSNNTTGVKGVSLNKRTGRYVANIKSEKSIFLGYWQTKEGAEFAYRCAESLLFKDFARPCEKEIPENIKQKVCSILQKHEIAFAE